MGARHSTKLLSVLAIASAFAVFWLFLAPTGIGGRTSYVVTDGVSMQPRFHSGDLAVVRAQGDYRVGEIVAYQSIALHTVVLHRIVGRDGSRYIFKGDNNNFLDIEHPARSQLIGSLWLHVPGAGAKLESLRSPLVLAAMLAAAVLLFAGGAFTRRERRRRRERRADETARVRRPGLGGGTSAAVAGAGVLALIPFALLAMIAFTRPATSLLPVSVPYGQGGAVSYSASAPAGPIYPSGHVGTGEPLFTRVLDNADFRFDYRFSSGAPHAVHGTVRLLETISSTSGWKVTLPLGRVSHFKGDQGRATGRLDVNALVALLHRVEATTAVSGSYTLVVSPRVVVRGTVSGLALRTTFTPNAQFSLNQYEIQPAAPSGQSPRSAFASAGSGSVAGRRPEPMVLHLGFASINVLAARKIGLGGVAMVTICTLALLLLARPRRRTEAELIAARYGHAVVSVARVTPPAGVPVIDLEDMDSLVGIAEHYDRSILHEETETGDVYWVADESGQFRYAASPGAVAESPATQAEPGYADELELAGVITAWALPGPAATEPREL